MIRNHIEYWVIECASRDWRITRGSFGSAVDAILAARDFKKLRPENNYEIMREWSTYWPADYFQIVDIEDEATGTWEPVINFLDEIQV